MKCTWVDCQNEAKYELRSKTREIWARLCDEHNSQIDSAIINSDVKGMLSGWIKAQGGAKKAADRVL